MKNKAVKQRERGHLNKENEMSALKKNRRIKTKCEMKRL